MCSSHCDEYEKDEKNLILNAYTKADLVFDVESLKVTAAGSSCSHSS